MKKLLFLPVVMLTLPAAMCSTTQQPGIEVRTVEVPVPVACVNEGDIPDPTPETPLTGDARVDTGLLKAENLDLRAEAGDLRALIVPGCITHSGSQTI